MIGKKWTEQVHHYFICILELKFQQIHPIFGILQTSIKGTPTGDRPFLVVLVPRFPVQILPEANPLNQALNTKKSTVWLGINIRKPGFVTGFNGQICRVKRNNMVIFIKLTSRGWWMSRFVHITYRSISWRLLLDDVNNEDIYQPLRSMVIQWWLLIILLYTLITYVINYHKGLYKTICPLLDINIYIYICIR